MSLSNHPLYEPILDSFYYHIHLIYLPVFPSVCLLQNSLFEKEIPIRSSYRYYIKHKDVPAWLERGFVLGYYGKKISTAQKQYQKFVEDQIGKEHVSPLKKVTGLTILGSSAFIKAVTEKYIIGKKKDRDIPALKEFVNKPTIKQISKELETVFTDDTAISRKIAIYLCHRFTGLKLKQIGEYFNIGLSGVSQCSRRIALEINKDARLRKKINKITNKLNL